MTAPLLPTAATLCALLTGVLLVFTRPSDPAADAASSRLVQMTAGSFAVGGRWSRTSEDAVLYYADPSGQPVVGLRGAVVADAGYCAGLPTSQRGFAGFTALAPGTDVAASTVAVASAWAAGIAGRDPPALTPSRLRLGDDTAAVRVTARLRAPATRDPCLSRRVVLDVVGFRAETGVVTFVLVRDVDRDGVSDAEAEEVVQSLRRRT